MRGDSMGMCANGWWGPYCPCVPVYKELSCHWGIVKC